MGRVEMLTFCWLMMSFKNSNWQFQTPGATVLFVSYSCVSSTSEKLGFLCLEEMLFHHLSSNCFPQTAAPQCTSELLASSLHHWHTHPSQPQCLKEIQSLQNSVGRLRKCVYAFVCMRQSKRNRTEERAGSKQELPFSDF